MVQIIKSGTQCQPGAYLEDLVPATPHFESEKHFNKKGEINHKRKGVCQA